MMASLPKKDEGTQGDKSADIDASHLTRNMFPDEDTPNLLFDGVRFQDLPICHIKCSLNNTILALTDGTGPSCCPVELLPCLRGQTCSAQAAALSFSSAAELRAIKNIRVIVKGLGPGRLDLRHHVDPSGAESAAHTIEEERTVVRRHLPHLGEFHFKQAFRVSPATFRFLVESCRCLLAVAGRREGAKAGN
ncbi:hypothetical protein HPB47_016356 [Ixodes persulcatus]|uniref:Uncharacterized protein n=1 Tax=Ixodes persulcatus TaxID=34615 RepID=A0AC60QR43_IXOPE|nr:hypothetical protein HPB47_016356 [Ixodes persulcatus]